MLTHQPKTAAESLRLALDIAELEAIHSLPSPDWFDRLVEWLIVREMRRRQDYWQKEFQRFNAMR